MAYKSKAMQKWAGENQPASVNNSANNGYKSAAMRNYEANMAKKAEESAQQAELEKQLQKEADLL